MPDEVGDDDPRSIGFNDSVELNGQTFHVQTEVTRRGELQSRSVVVEGGGVRFSETRPLPRRGSRESLEGEVRQRHDEVVARARRGEWA